MFLKKIDSHLQETLSECGFEKAFELQKQCIPKIKSGVDLLVKSGKKTGKTSSIVIGVIQQLKFKFKDVPRALIVVPEREEATNLKEQFLRLGKNTDLRVFCESDAGNLYDLRDLIYAGSDVVIATAKKINELYSFSGINLNNLKMFVVDDAELVIKEQILSEINRLAPYIPKSQRIVFCNRFTPQMSKFADENMNFPTVLDFD